MAIEQDAYSNKVCNLLPKILLLVLVISLRCLCLLFTCRLFSTVTTGWARMSNATTENADGVGFLQASPNQQRFCSFYPAYMFQVVNYWTDSVVAAVDNELFHKASSQDEIMLAVMSSVLSVV